MNFSLTFGAGSALLAAVCIFSIFALLRPPALVMGGTMTSRAFYDRAMVRLAMITLVAAALLPLEAADQMMTLSPQILTPKAVLSHKFELLSSVGIMLAPLVVIYLFRRLISRMAARRRSPMGGFNMVLGAYAAFAGIMTFASTMVITAA